MTTSQLQVGRLYACSDKIKRKLMRIKHPWCWCVRHGEGTGPIQLRVTVGPSTIRVEVEDPGPGFALPLDLDPRGRHDGWGLLLVDRISARWGVVAGATTLVWFEIERAA